MVGDIPTDEEFFLSVPQRALPAHERARLISEEYAAGMIAIDGRDISAAVTRVAYALRYLVCAARLGGRRWDRAWSRAGREVGPLLAHKMTVERKALFYMCARGQI